MTNKQAAQITLFNQPATIGNVTVDEYIDHLIKRHPELDKQEVMSEYRKLAKR